MKKIDKILDLIKKHLNNVIHEEDFIILPLSNNKISIVLRILKNNADKHIYILEVMEEIRIELAKKTKSSVTIGVGRSYKKIEDLKISYHEALNAQQYAEQFGSGIIHVENINEFNQYSVRYPVKEKEKMISLIKLGDIENGRIALNEFIGKFKKFIEEKPEILKIRLYELVSSLIDSALLSGGNEKRLDELITKCLDDINHFSDINIIEEWISSIVSEILVIVSNVYEKRSKVLIQNAKKYIENNYNMQLSYKDVAREIFISPSYFLNLFKQEMGFTFVDYLTSVRINKAKELLLTTELNITEIAFDLGFNNSNYFSNIFKKTVGMSAVNYRKKLKKI